MIRSLGFFTMLCAGGAQAAVQAQTSHVSDSSAAAAVVTEYLQGLQFNDTLRLAHAFWPSTKLLWVKRDSTLGELTQAAWYASFRGSVGQPVEGSLRLVRLELTGSAAAAGQGWWGADRAWRGACEGDRVGPDRHHGAANGCDNVRGMRRLARL